MIMYLILLLLIIILPSNYAKSGDINTYLILSKQKSLLDNADIISNNIANADTTAFKEIYLVERQYELQHLDGTSTDYANDIATMRKMENGSLINSDNPFNFAIIGDGFFAVETNKGERYTRDGNFTLNYERVLVTMDGDNVLSPEKEKIILPANAKNVVVKNSGQLVVDNVAVEKIAVVRFENNNMLLQEGGSLYKHSKDELPITLDSTDHDFKIMQGFLESSNVNKIVQLTRLLEVQRDVTYTSTLLNQYNDLSKSVVSKLNNN